MFYHQNLLTDKQSGLGVVWLAATLGNKSHVRKLGKRDILSVHVPKACKYLIAPPQPLALRTSSSLMVGVARVLDCQYKFFFADVTDAHDKLRQGLLSMRDKRANNLELKQRAGDRMDAVTLQDDPFFDLAFDTQGNLDFLNHDVEELVTMDLSKDDNLSNLSVRATSLNSGQLAGASPSISLPGGLSSYDHQLPSRTRTELGNLDLHGLIEEESDPLGPDGAGDMLDFEFDNTGQMKEVDHVDDGYPSEKHSLDDVDLSGERQKFHKRIKHDIDPLGIFDEQDEDRVAGLFGDASGFSPLPLAESSRIQLDDAPVFDFVDEEPSATVAIASRKKRKRVAKVQMDANIHIASATLVEWRETYDARMLAFQKKRKLTRNVLDRFVSQQVWGFQGALLHPDLTKLFCSKPTGRQSTAQDEGEPLPDQYITEPEMAMPFDHDEAGMEPADVELGRIAPSQEPGDTVLSMRQQTLPWNLSRSERTPSVTGHGLDSVGRGRQGSVLLGTPVPFSFMETPRRGQDSIIAGSESRIGGRPGARFSSVAAGGGLDRLDSLEAPMDVSLDNVLDNAGEDPSSGLQVTNGNVAIDTQMANDSQYLLSTIQQESYNFLEYTRERIFHKHSDELSQDDDAAEESITFGDLVPRQTNDRFVAAQALSHVLLLASRGALKVSQGNAYGPIVLSDLVQG